MSKMLKKVDEDNEGTNKMSMSESENQRTHKRNLGARQGKHK